MSAENVEQKFPRTSLGAGGECLGEDLHGLVEVGVLEDFDPGNEDIEAREVGDGLAEVGQLREIRKLKGQLEQGRDGPVPRGKVAG